MSFEEGNGELLRPSPCIVVNSYLGKISLTYFNTTMKTFRDRQYNHLEHIHETEGLLGIAAEPDVFGILHEAGFPFDYRPYPDDATMNWYVQLQTGRLVEEIDEALS